MRVTSMRGKGVFSTITDAFAVTILLLLLTEMLYISASWLRKFFCQK